MGLVVVTRVLAVIACLWVLAIGTPASAQTPPPTVVCNNMPTPSQRIDCTRAVTSTDDIDINLQSGVNITTTGADDHGILGHHKGVGDITINVNGAQNNKTITTEGVRANGVSALREGKGSVDITVTNVDITTNGEGSAAQNAHGVSARQNFRLGEQPPYDGPYHVKIKVTDSQINTKGNASFGISGYHDGNTNDSIINSGNLEITTNNTDITTTGDFGHGIHALAVNTEGDVIITVTDGVITTAGPYALGINSINGSSTGAGESGNAMIHVTDADIRTTYDGSDGADPPFGLYALNRTDGDGDVTVTLTDTNISTMISTMGPRADAVRALRQRGSGDVLITIRGGQITTNHYQAEAILGWHDGSEGATGDVRIDLQGVTIETNGEQLVPNQRELSRIVDGPLFREGFPMCQAKARER